MKLSEEKMRHILKPGVMILSEILNKAGFEIRFVGGTVRDLIMGIIPTDIDIATTASFIDMKKVFNAHEQVRILRASEKHNTILVRIAEENLDCTTLVDTPQSYKTIDNKTITPTDWELDASHRDLTINALYLSLDGTVYDYFNGLEHLKNKVVTFVLNPDERIEEDPLRILRYFRFFGRITSDPSHHEAAAWDSICKNCDKVSRVFPEVIWKEVKMIVQGKFGVDLFIQMFKCGVGRHIGIPQNFECDALASTFKRLQNAELESQIDPCALLASGLTTEEDVIDLVTRLKLSHKEKDILKLIVTKKSLVSSPDLIKELRHLLVDLVYKEKRSSKAAIETVCEFCKFAGRSDLLSEINKDLIPEFPIKGGKLVGLVPKRQIYKEMKKLLIIWQESDYSLGHEELLNKIKL